ncbi:hypothetical protein L198_07346 [Cryptococcus wingfieldii CBS 7118]|uniref:Uncharacterized protein n=1 Tax=Cryptococcus wingfieldii CBS 7118 TaxID=1295528 RepID=A0A1E3ICJ4_9TREE|nr:hypothetical protein L198_07346 [Cryptococcus wingfieldii CBS 7118]ODN86327.1 hypothetical protein L198_07346 [Cryptococcus wingfieldii CBS 7118]
MAEAGPSTQTRGSPAVPQSVNRSSVSLYPLSGILRSIWDVPAVAPTTNPPIDTLSQSSVPNAYPSDIGHPGNGIFGGPLRLVPFDLSKSHHYPNGLTIKPYENVDQDWMGSHWIECYPSIQHEHHFQYQHVVLYLREFYVDPKAVYPTSWNTDVNFHSNRFYIPLGKKFTDLEIVKSVREHDPKLLKTGTSEVTSQMSTKFSGIKPDVCLTGYHIGTLAEGTYRQELEGGGKLRRPIAPKGSSTLKSSSKLDEAEELDIRRTIDQHLKGLQYANMEAITQTIFYSLLGHDVSKCRSAMALVNGNYTRILNLSHLVPEGEEVDWEGVALGAGGGRRILVEADPDVVAKLRRRDNHCLSPEQFGLLAAGEPFNGIQWQAPNSIIANYEDWTLDQGAKDRLDATQLVFFENSALYPLSESFATAQDFSPDLSLGHPPTYYKAGGKSTLSQLSTYPFLLLLLRQPIKSSHRD